MRYFDAIMMLTVIGMGCAIVVLPYVVLRSLLLREVRVIKIEDSAMNFMLSIVNTFLFGGLVTLIFYVSNLIGIMQYVVFLVIAPAGIFSIIFLLIKNTSSNAIEHLDVREKHPLPNLTFWLQDLMIFVLSQGVVMAVCQRLFGRENLRQVVFVMALEGIGLLFILDVCRRSEMLRDARKRAVFLAVMLGMSAFWPTLFVTIYAWMAWNYVDWKMKV